MNSKKRRVKETTREKIILAVVHGGGAVRLFCEEALAFVKLSWSTWVGSGCSKA